MVDFYLVRLGNQPVAIREWRGAYVVATVGAESIKRRIARTMGVDHHYGYVEMPPGYGLARGNPHVPAEVRERYAPLTIEMSAAVVGNGPAGVPLVRRNDAWERLLARQAAAAKPPPTGIEAYVA